MFLGMVNFYHHFLPGVARVLRPLTDCLRGGPKGPTADVVELSPSRGSEYIAYICLESSLGRASACGAGGRRFEPRP